MKTISTDSWIYKLYAKQVHRTTIYWESEVPGRPTNICDIGRRAFFQAMRNTVEFALIAAGFSFLIWLALVPLLTFGFYFFTDNPFIIWFGEFGAAVLLLEGGILVALTIMGVLVGIFKLFKFSSKHISFPEFTSTWISNKFEGICTPIKVEVKDSNE